MNSNNSPQPNASWTPHERPGCMRGGGGERLEGGGQRRSKTPASSRFQTGPEVIRFSKELSCHSPPAARAPPSLFPKSQDSPLSHFSALFAISPSLFSSPPLLAPPPLLHSNLRLFCQHPLCAQCAGQIQRAPWQPSKPCMAGIL